MPISIFLIESAKTDLLLLMQESESKVSQIMSPVLKKMKVSKGKIWYILLLKENIMRNSESSVDIWMFKVSQISSH